jgi:transcriptional regulator with XRE-family HTH domain
MKAGGKTRRSERDLRVIGARVREMRTASGLSQESLAERADVHDRTVGEIERGELNFSVRVLLKLCGALKTTPNDILVGH